jgi:hypothetical protein
MSLPPTLKTRKISTPAGNEPLLPPSDSFDYTPNVMQPIPNLDFIPGLTSSDAPVKKVNTDIIKENEPVLILYDHNNKVGMLQKPLEDKMLDQVNIQVFDQIQKVVDEVNKGYNYKHKNDILTLCLTNHTQLRKYEDIIRKLTGMSVEPDPFSLEKLQQRICSDHWLGLFFKKVNETRTYGKKLTIDDWRTVKSTIITYYLNYFLQKKTGYAIKQEKLAFFSTLCLRLRPDNKKFQDFVIMELKDTSLTSAFDNKLQTNGKDSIFLPDSLIEKESSFKDDFRKSEYTDIMDLINAVDRVYNEDSDVSALNKNLKENGVSPYNLRSIGATLLSGLDGVGSFVSSVGGGVAASNYIPLLFGATTTGSLPFLAVASLALAGTYTANRLYNSTAGSMIRSFFNDGAIVNPTNTAQTYNVSIGEIKKSGDKYIQTGFYITLCTFVDETLDKCKDAFEGKYGAIQWGKPKTEDVPFNLSDFLNCQKQRAELSDLVTLVTDATEKQKIKASIHDFPRATSYNDIRKEIDRELVKQLKAFIANPASNLETAITFADENEFKTKFDTFKKEYKAIFDKTKRTDWDKVFNGKVNAAWSSGPSATSGKKTFSDGTSMTSTIPGHRSHRKSDGSNKKSYKASPDYGRLKKSFKDGEISKQQFKDGKHLLKRSMSRR